MTESNIKAEILNASAGSGKTYQLTYRYVCDILRNQPEHKGGGFDPYAYRRILAVTFTNKATEEMKSRILKQIHRLGAGLKSPYLENLMAETSLSERELRRRAARARTAILHDYSRFAILTNDTFFQRILRGFIKELGIDMNYNIELDEASLLTQSVDELMEEIAENADLKQWISEIAKDNIIDGKQWNIRGDILKLHKELFKENTKQQITSITDKQHFKKSIFGHIKHIDTEMARLQEVAREAVSMISAAGYSNDDFNGKFTKYFDAVAEGKPNAPSATIIKHLDDTPQEWFTKAKKPSADLLDLAERLQPMLEQVCRYKSLEIGRQLILENYRSYALLNDIYRKAMEICHEENRMLISETKHTIAEFITEADAPFIYEKVGNRFERYMIDEFQDTSLREWKNFLPLLRNAMAQSANAAVLLVGDIKQSIYRWRGGDWSILGRVAPADLAHNGNEIHTDTLKNNFRSLPKIVSFNNDIFDKIVSTDNARLNDHLLSAHKSQIISRSKCEELQNMLADAYNGHEQIARRESRNEGYINVSTYVGEPDIVARVKEIIDKGFRPCDITILVRWNRESFGIAQQLLRVNEEGDERYRWDIMTQEALSLANAPAVQFIIAVLRLSLNRKDATSRGIYNRYFHNNDFIRKFNDEEIEFFDALRALSVEEAFEHIVIHYKEYLNRHTAYVQALHEHVVQFCAGKTADTTMFLRWWDDNGHNKSVSIERNPQAIEIMTIHKAKGLQNKVIILPFCTWELKPKSTTGNRINIMWAKPNTDTGLDTELKFPVSIKEDVSRSIFAEEYNEELVYSHIEAINILYVALTRACEQLHIYIPAAKLHVSKDGKTKDTSTKKPSTVGDLLKEALALPDEYSARVCFEAGRFEQPEAEAQHNSDDEPTHSTVRLTEYNTSPVGVRMSSSMSHYFDDSPTLSPRDAGIMLHKAFERATSREDIPQAIKQMVLDGLLSDTEADTLQTNIEKVLDGSIAAQWFADGWDKVLCESSIIVPNVGAKRPDRVMIKGERVVVVDYKFGEREPTHRKQVGSYLAQLRKMGYTTAEGYVWYVNRGEIDKIE